MSNSKMFDDDLEIITLTNEKDEDIDFAVINSVVMDDLTYYLVVEARHIEDDNVEAMILKKIEEDEEDYILEFVEEDEEFLKITKIFEDGSEDFNFEFI